MPTRNTRTSENQEEAATATETKSDRTTPPCNELPSEMQPY